MTDDQRRRVHEITYNTDDRQELAERIVTLEDKLRSRELESIALPVDADGQTIHLGDVLITTRGSSADVGEVTSIEFQRKPEGTRRDGDADTENTALVTIGFEYDSCAMDFAQYFRHYETVSTSRGRDEK
jgi:hypothetical protein